LAVSTPSPADAPVISAVVPVRSTLSRISSVVVSGPPAASCHRGSGAAESGASEQERVD
jgi:hypothetical protein